MVARPDVLRFEDRWEPAEVIWEGSIGWQWTDGRNWQGGNPPGLNDTAILGATTGFPPAIGTGQTASVGNVKMINTCTYNLTIDGTLNTNGSLIQPAEAHGFVGSGNLWLKDTADAPIDHVWVNGFVKVNTVGVEGGSVLEVRSTFGQLGPDDALSVASNWTVGGNDSGGKMLMNGDHFIGFNWLTVKGQGELQFVTGGTLTDYPPSPPAAWRPFAISNNGKVEIAELQTVNLTGGKYEQTEGTTTFQPGSALNIAGFAGATAVPDYSFRIMGGKVLAYENAGVSAKTDIAIQNSTLEFYSPGFFTRGGGLQQGSQIGLTARDGMMAKEVFIENSPIKFLDWAPAGRYTTATQVEGNIAVGGNLKLEGSTALFVRADVFNSKVDRISASMDDLTISGNAVNLSIDLRNIGISQFAYLTNLLYGWTMTTPGDPFGQVDITGANGWIATIYRVGTRIDVSLSDA